MKKRICLCYFALCYVGTFFAQDLSPSVIVPQGAISEIDNTSLEWTLGEVFTQTLIHEEGILTQGSEQPFLEVKPLVLNTLDATLTHIDVQVYPNPVARRLTVVLSAETSNVLDITLTDLSGKTMLQTTGNTESDRLELDIAIMPSGTYFLSFKEKNGRLVKIFKVNKIYD